MYSSIWCLSYPVTGAERILVERWDGPAHLQAVHQTVNTLLTLDTGAEHAALCSPLSVRADWTAPLRAPSCRTLENFCYKVGGANERFLPIAFRVFATAEVLPTHQLHCLWGVGSRLIWCKYRMISKCLVNRLVDLFFLITKTRLALRTVDVSATK